MCSTSHRHRLTTWRTETSHTRTIRSAGAPSLLGRRRTVGLRYPIASYPSVAYVLVTFRQGRNVAGSDIFTGSLELLLLKALSWGPMHGYAIARWIRVSTREGLTVREGALYPALHRLQAKGFLAEEWGMTDTNREAKFYRLTPAGRKQLVAEVARWRAYSRL